MNIKAVFAATALICSPAVLGGSLGSTSSDSTEVSVTVDDLVRVSVSGNIGLTHTVGSNSTGSAGLCIYRNGTASVSLTLTSANADTSNGFRMTDGTAFLPYAVALSGADTVASFTSGVAASLSNANTTDSLCGGTANYGHDIDVTVQQTDIDAAAAGSYADTITILVEPA